MIVPDGLDRPAALDIERSHLHVAHAGELAAKVSTALTDAGLLPEPVDLHRLHEHLPAEARVLDEYYMNEPTRALYRYADQLGSAYEAVVADVADRVLGADALFQTAPVLRVHLPGPFPPNLTGASGRGIQVHSDTLGGHPFEMLNVWLSLTDARDGGALHLAPRDESLAILRDFCRRSRAEDFRSSLADFHRLLAEDPAFEQRVRSACDPWESHPGELVVFDPRCLHGGVENDSGATRVSLDFRVVPLPRDRAVTGRFEQELAAGAPRWRRGDLLDPRSASELDL